MVFVARSIVVIESAAKTVAGFRAANVLRRRAAIAGFASVITKRAAIPAVERARFVTRAPVVCRTARASCAARTAAGACADLARTIKSVWMESVFARLSSARAGVAQTPARFAMKVCAANRIARTRSAAWTVVEGIAESAIRLPNVLKAGVNVITSRVKAFAVTGKRCVTKMLAAFRIAPKRNVEMTVVEVAAGLVKTTRCVTIMGVALVRPFGATEYAVSMARFVMTTRHVAHLIAPERVAAMMAAEGCAPQSAHWSSVAPGITLALRVGFMSERVLS